MINELTYENFNLKGAARMIKKHIRLVLMLLLMITTLVQAFAPAVADANTTGNITKVSNSASLFDSKSQVTSESQKPDSKATSSKIESQVSDKLQVKNEQEINQYQLKLEGSTIIVEDHFKLQLSASNNINKEIQLQIPTGLSIDLVASQKGNPNFEITKTNSQTLKVVPKEIAVKLKIVNLVLIANQTGQYLIQGSDQDSVAIKSENLKVINNPTPKVLALAPDTFDDGITNWVRKNRTEVGSKAFEGSSNRFLRYTFGGVRGGLDPERLAYLSGDYNIFGTQMNIFIKDRYSTVQAYYNGYSDGYGAVRTSTGFGLVFSPNERNAGNKQSILGNLLTDKSYFVGYDSEGNLVSKIMGRFERDGKTLSAQILLRPSLSGATVVQQELYLKNETNEPVSYGAFIAHDTMLDRNDDVPMYAMANNSGIYIVDGSYKLLINMNIPDGPSNYGVQEWRKNNQLWFDGFNPRDFSGTGLEQDNLPEGKKVLSNVDTSYTAKWPFTTLQPGESKHYRQDLGLTKAPDVSPEAFKEYKNETSTDGNNRVGDKIQFTLRAHNNGLKASWGKVVFSDVIPSDLEIDPNTIKLTDQNGLETNVSPNAYNQTTRELRVEVPGNILEGQWASVTFDTTALKSASGKVVQNKVDVTGVDNEVNQQERSASASVDVPFIKIPTNVAITQKIKNETTPDNEWLQETEGSLGDIIAYKFEITAQSDNTEEINKAILKEITNHENDLELTDDDIEVSVKQTDGQTYTWSADRNDFSNSHLINLWDDTHLTLKPGDVVTVNYKMRIITEDEKTITNDAKVSADNLIDMTAPTTILNVKKGKGDIKIRYINRQTGQLITSAPNTNGTGEIILNGKIGSSVSELANKLGIVDSLTPQTISGYTPIDQTITPTDDISQATFQPVEKTDPKIAKETQVYTYRYEQATISIEVPDIWYFGRFDTSQIDRTYYLPAKENAENKKEPYKVKVNDYYGLDNWKLSVKQDGQFRSDAKQTDDSKTDNPKQPVALKSRELDDAQFSAEYLTSQLIAGESEPVSGVLTNKNQFTLDKSGTGEVTDLLVYEKSGHLATDNHIKNDELNTTYDSPGWNIAQLQFGNVQQADYSIGLHVPKTTKRYKTYYKSGLTWTLSIAP